MKEVIIDSFKKTLADRYLFMVLSSMIFFSLVFAVIIAFAIHPSELQLVLHYSAFGVTHIYRDQWYYLIVFVLFGPIIAALHTIISVKLLLIKGRSLALLYAWLGVSVVLIGFIISLAVLNVWTPV